MSKRNILIKKKNGSTWDELYPITTANNIKCSNGKDVETQLKEKANQTTVDLINVKLTDYSSYASSKDANGIYTVIEYKRVDATLYMKSTLSNIDANGNYQTDTWQFYGTNGATLINTKTWTITYDADGNIISKVVN